jgi:thymidylate synthase
MGGLMSDIITFSGNTAGQLYEEGLQRFRVSGRKEHTRNGPAMVLPEIAVFTLNHPQRRVLDDPTRNANPFFHMMEFIWMMAGRLDSKWISQFNKRMETFADNGELKAAYGYRWRYHYAVDQVYWVIQQLAKDPMTRQAVIGIWDPDMDLTTNHKDKACNVTLMFRNNAGALDMLVCNRSNDFIWGALGSNVVHFTMLHECVAHFSGIPLGKYSVLSINLHMYTDRPDFDRAWKQLAVEEVYDKVSHLEMFSPTESFTPFATDCERFCVDHEGPFATEWMHSVAEPVRQAWFAHKAGHDDAAVHEVSRIEAPDWRMACQNWLDRNSKGE